MFVMFCIFLTKKNAQAIDNTR